jgi:S1-C subfamily serine protease
MGRYSFIAAGVGALGAALILFIAPAAPTPVSSVVEIFSERGHGTGTHIGGGYILTAGHVGDIALSTTTDGDVIQIKDANGKAQWAEVVVKNKRYDVCILKVFDYAGLGVAPMAETPVDVGTPIHANGFPLSMGNMTTWGRVASGERKVGNWARAVMVDITARPGMSGSAMLDEAGNVVGILVGGQEGTIVVMIPIDVIRFVLPAV